MYEEIRAFAESFCEEAFEAWNACGYVNEMTAAEFIVKIAEMMLLQAHQWNLEEEDE